MPKASKKNARQANANAQREQEIADLITAVKDHKKFKQLACYSIQALDKAIDPEQSRHTYRENVKLAISLDAAAVVCDILHRHKGHEQVLMVCTECLIKLATDRTNAAVIASNNAVPFLLESISSNPDLPEEVLHMAMTLLNNLCSHQKVGAMVLNEETLAQCLKVLETNSDTMVLNSVINVIEKMSKNTELASMLNESCVPVLLKALDQICSLDLIDEAAEDCVLNATKVFQRLLKTTTEQTSRMSSTGENAAAQRLKELGGIDTYLRVMEAFKDSERVTRVVSKLITKMMGGNIAELMATLQQTNLSEGAQEKVLSLISSMAMDSSSMDEIMKSGGVSSMIGAMETKMSRRALEETARTVARLASSPKNIPELVAGGALDQICKILTSSQLGNASDDNDLAADVVASMLVAINRICAVVPSAVSTVVEAGVVPRLCAAVELHNDNKGLVRPALEFFGRLRNEDIVRGKASGKVDLAAMIAATVPALEQAVEAGDNETAKVCITALQSLQDDVTGAPDVVRPLVIQAGCVELALGALSGAAQESDHHLGQRSVTNAAAAKLASELSVASLTFLSGCAASDAGLEKLHEHDAFGIVVESVGNSIGDHRLRAAAVRLIQQISSDDLINEFCSVLVDYSVRFANGEIDESDAEETAAIPKLALALATLAMVSGNIPKLQAAGGVAPMVVLLGAIAAMRSCSSQEELMATFASCLNEIVVASSSESIASAQLFDTAQLVSNCVLVLKNHSQKSMACQSVLRLLRSGISKCPAVFAPPLTESGGIDAIATQIRLHPSDAPELLNDALRIYSALVKFEGDGGDGSGEDASGGSAAASAKARDIIQRSGRQLILSMEQLADTSEPSGRAALLPAMELLEACAQTNEGRSITSKLGAVKCVLAVLEAQHDQPDIVEQCSRTLTAIVTSNDVTKVVQRLQAHVDEPETGLRAAPTSEAAIMVVSDDVKKLGLLMMCGDFSTVIQASGGVQTIVDIITVLVESARHSNADASEGAAAARDELVRNCITAFGRAAAGNIQLRDATGIVGEVVRAMTDDPTSEVFKAVAALAKSDAKLCQSLIAADAIEALVPLLADIDDDDTLNASFEALAAFCTTQEGVDRVMRAGGLDFVIEHLREEVDGASTSQLSKAVNLLQSITQHGSPALSSHITTTLVEAGVLDLVNDSLSQLMSADRAADVETATGLQDLLTSMITSTKDMGASDAALVSQGVMSSGIVQHVDALMNADNAYMGNVECVMATNQMLAALCNGGYSEGLHSINADQMLLRAMNANSTDVELARCCAQTVGAIDADTAGGGGKATLSAVAEQSEAALRALEEAVAGLETAQSGGAGRESVVLEASGSIAKQLVELTSGMQLLANLVLLDGSVDQTSADRLALLAVKSLTALTTVPSSSQALGAKVDEAEAVSLTLLGRLAALDHVTIDADAATAATVGFVQDEYASDELLASAITCIAGIAHSSRGVQSIARRGMVAHVQRQAHARGRVAASTGPSVGDSGSADVGSAATSCMETLRMQAVSNAAALVTAEGGAAAIASILAGIDDHRILGTTIDQIIAADGGLQVLLDVLCEMGPPDFGGNRIAVEAVILALLHARDAGSKLVVTTPAQTAAIVAASMLSPAIASDTSSGGGDDGGGSGGSNVSVDSALVLLESALENDDGCLVVAKTPGALEALVDGMTSINVAVSNSCVGSIAMLAGKNNPEINRRLVECGVADATIHALRMADDPEEPFTASTMFHESAIYTVSGTIRTIGVEEAGYTRDAMRVIDDLSQTFEHSQAADSPYCLELCQQVLQALTNAFADGTGSLLEGKLQEMGALSADRLAWQAVPSGDGSTYYYNKATNETQWEQPEDHGLLLADLEALGDLVTQLHGDLSQIDPSAFKTLVPLVTSQARDKDTMNAVCKVLAAATKSKSTGAVLASMDEIGDIVAAMQYNLEDEEFMLNSTEILTQLTEFNQFKVALSNLEYIKVLNDTCQQHIDNESLVVRCLGTLGNLAWNHPENAQSCIACGVPETLKKTMTTHRASAKACDTAIFVLEHMLEGINDEEEPQEEVEAQKLEICYEVNEPMLGALEMYSNIPDFFIKAVRCLGSLSLVDDCIVLMVEAGATRLTVHGMREHANRPEHVASAIELISNFGAIEDDELDEQMTAYLIEEGGLDAILDVMKTYDTSVPLLLIGFEALYNIGNDGEAAEKLVELGVVHQSFTVLQNFDYEKKLCAQVMKFLAVLTYNDPAVEAIAEGHLLPIIFQAMRTRVENEEFMLDALTAVANAVPDPRCQTVANENDLLKQILELLTLYDTSAEVTSQVVLTCIRLATNEDISVKVALEGMPFFMRATAKLGMEDIDLLSLLFELLFHLAFTKDNIKIMVQHGCIKTLLAIMDVEEYQEDAELMMKAVGMMDNVVSADEEFASIVKDKGGKTLLKTLVEVHAGDDSMRTAVQSTLLSMEAKLQSKAQDGSKTGRAELFRRLGEDAVNIRGDRHVKIGNDENREPEEDPLIEYRDFLLAGQVCKVWKGKGNFTTMVLFVSEKWDAVIFKSTVKGDRKGERCTFRSMDKVEEGYGKEHLKKSSFGPPTCKDDASCCIHVLNRPRAGETAKPLLCLSFNSAEEKNHTQKALERVVQTTKLWPHRLILAKSPHTKS